MYMYVQIVGRNASIDAAKRRGTRCASGLATPAARGATAFPQGLLATKMCAHATPTWQLTVVTTSVLRWSEVEQLKQDYCNTAISFITLMFSVLSMYWNTVVVNSTVFWLYICYMKCNRLSNLWKRCAHNWNVLCGAFYSYFYVAICFSKQVFMHGLTSPKVNNSTRIETYGAYQVHKYNPRKWPCGLSWVVELHSS